MRFCLVSKHFVGRPPKFEGMDSVSPVGGAEVNLFRLASLLQERGHEPYVVQKRAHVEVDEYEGIEVRSVQTAGLERFVSDEIAFSLRWRQAVDPGSVVHLQHEGYGFPSFSGVHSINQQGIAWDYPGRRGLGTRVKLWGLRRMLRKGALVRASDNSFLSYVQSEWPEHQSSVYPIPNGVDTDEFAPRGMQRDELGLGNCPRPIILFPRTVTVYRGALLLLEALAELREAGLDFGAVFVGALRSDVRANVEELVTRGGLEEHCSFVGHVPNERMVDYYNVADIVTIPTYHSEGSSIACLEAMACGRPVVVTDVGGLKELVYQSHEDGGIKVKPRVSDIAEALRTLIVDDELRARMGERARKRVLTYYTLERWKRQMSEYIERVVEASGKR